MKLVPENFGGVESPTEAVFICHIDLVYPVTYISLTKETDVYIDLPLEHYCSHHAPLERRCGRKR